MHSEEYSSGIQRKSNSSNNSAFKGLKEIDSGISGIRSPKHYGTLKEFPSKYYNELKNYRKEKSSQRDKGSLGQELLAQSRESLHIQESSNTRESSKVRKSIEKVPSDDSNIFSARNRIAGLVDQKLKDISNEPISYKSALRRPNSGISKEQIANNLEKLKTRVQPAKIENPQKAGYLQTETNEIRKSYHFDSESLIEMKKALERREKLVKNRESELAEREKALFEREKEIKNMTSFTREENGGFRSQGYKAFSKGNPLESSDCENFFNPKSHERNPSAKHKRKGENSCGGETRVDIGNSLEEDLSRMIKRGKENGKEDEGKVREGLIRSQSSKRKTSSNHSASQGNFPKSDSENSAKEILRKIAGIFKYSGSSFTSLEFRMKEQIEELGLYRKFQENLGQALGVKDVPLKTLWKMLKEKMEKYMIMKKEAKEKNSELLNYIGKSEYSGDELLEIIRENEIMREIVDIAKSKSTEKYL